MYKVFVNDKLIRLIDDYSEYSSDDYTLFLKFYSKESVSFAVDLLMKNKRIKQLVVFHEKLDELWRNFQSLYNVIEAGGGVVKNDNNKTLFIFKYGKWDLPKGKVNDGEPVRDAALREVKEESGVNGLEIIRELGITHHLFPEGNSIVLKNTHWYEMKTHYDGELKADKNEGIEKAKWLDKAGMEEAFQNTYPSVIEMCKASLSGN